MEPLHIDFETRSAADLKVVGLDNYACDPSTAIWCMAYAFGDGPVTIVGESEPSLERMTASRVLIIKYIQSGGLVYAHNAAFELAIWNAVMPDCWPRLDPKQVRCTMAMAYAMGLPGSLDGAAAALGIEQRKDAKGSRVMMQLAKPRKVVQHLPEHDGATGYIEHVWWDDPVKLQTLYDYCKQDVEVERALHKRMVELSADEQSLWHLDQTINARGIQVDRASIDAAIDLVTAEKIRLDEAMRKTTGNVVAGCTDVRQLTAWLRYKGVDTPGIAKADVSELLNRDDLVDECRTALMLRQEAAKSSTAKLVAMRDRAGPDGRMRGLFQYHGAATGRWAGRGPQPHNFPRPTLLHDQDDIEDVIAHFGQPEYLRVFYGDPMPLTADCMRGMIVAGPGKELVCCDYSNIEGRVLAWLAGEEWKLQAFRDYDAGTGADLYLLAYAKGFRCSLEAAKPFRQVGKVMELALGYGGGVGAFQKMARGYGVVVSDERADELKVAWRGAHPQVVKFWRDLEAAAIRAVQEGGVQKVRDIAFKVAGSFLWCQLPSKRVLCYPYPQIRNKETPRGAVVPALTYMAVNGVTRKWERCDTYGGSLAENVTQAVARDILVAGMRAVETLGAPVVMHVHDEIVCECNLHEISVDEIATVMSNVPHWATGLPVAATGWQGQRYRKD
ncbi:DNA polymerase [Dyella kyungheensis]|uniref:DNA polymerase n=1 Tax=Dyella kyungheensis TaxID=1242174 RepID=UPI003CF02A86